VRDVVSSREARSEALSRRAAASIAALHVVVSLDAEQVREIDARDADDAERILGVARSSAALGEQVEVVRLGVVQDGSCSWERGKPVYVSAAGALTHQPELLGAPFWARMGVAVAADAIFIDPQPPLFF
jgi:Uncharacterized conserved protein (DUF2190)